MTDQLPTIADAAASAIAERIASEMQADAAAFAGKLSTVVPDPGRPPEHLELSSVGLQRGEAVWSELHTASAITPQQLEYAQPVLAEYGPLFQEARRAGDHAELSRLAHNLGLDLVIAGALTVPQLDRMRPILARFNPQAESYLRTLSPAPRSPGSAADVSEMRELTRLMADTGSRYWRGPDAERLQARWRELHNQGVRGNAVALTAPDQVDGRIAEIERLMADTSSEYWRGPNATALEREYRDLVDQRALLKRRP